MIFGATVVLLRGADGSVRRPATLVTVATLLLVVGDAYFGYRQARFPGLAPDRWQFACWLTGHFLLAMAAFTQVRAAGGHELRVEDPRAGTATRLPYLAMGLGYALLLFAVRGSEMRIVGLALGAVAMTSVVVTRQIVSLRENQELATTDTLTGLVNRRHLYDRLRLAIGRRGRGGRTIAAVLIDMNGFKQVNDTMGHEAGDQLLIAFGRILRASVLGTDVVGRLGGDEFAIVLHDIATTDHAIAVVHRIMTAMEEPVVVGSVAVQPQASFGIALARPGETTPTPCCTGPTWRCTGPNRGGRPGTRSRSRSRTDGVAGRAPWTWTRVDAGARPGHAAAALIPTGGGDGSTAAADGGSTAAAGRLDGGDPRTVTA